MPYFLRVLAADPRHFPKFMRYGANAERAHPADRHWYLVVAGVRPEAQRQDWARGSYGMSLMRPTSMAYPSTWRRRDRANIAYYERFGFTVIDEALKLVPGGPAHVAMRRPVGG
jgi:hypothetical protein